MGELLINTTTSGSQSQPCVDSVRGTQYEAMWADGSDVSIKGQTLNTDGVKVGQEFPVAAPTPSDGNANRQWPALEFSGSGSFVVWTEQPFNIPPPLPQVKMQRFFDGQPAGPQVRVSTTDIDPTNRPSLTRLIDGGCVVVWTGARQDQRIRAQRFTIEGNKSGPEMTVNTTEGFHNSPAVTVLANGNYVVAWTSDPSSIGGNRLTYRVFNFDGSPRGGEIQPNVSGFQGRNSLTLLDTGKFVIAHIEGIGPSDLGVSQTTVEASIFDPNGDGSVITSVIAGPPRDFNRSWPALAPMPGGRFLLAWVEKSAVTFQTVPTVMAKMCSESQLSLSEKVQVSSATTGGRAQVCAAAAFGDGAESVFIAWSDSGGAQGDTSDASVRGRAFQVTSSGELIG
ncbi:hypothetical protein AR457_02825 [Streptomyces agglomeratus]|uniref:Ricin B lectin domain-containing protein n=1 Tax=Streptomyces agglomeratus TaxID=285458 RepID=A0A1E5P235_9ACTN|nr:hypothetical protein [Streptomyces agglomeratus]OEJ23590.1 hypothetical protein AS594_02930 [Streptomyces agglomeratus]OEJ43183.1 hypothetical protein AR457_02825 [Streptomyces agglomeratus]OEJ54895.1 hypothetical protein BGK72_32945 [Streptomyces agglomeratus]OEJ62266.1 hypothetical protein BGM19_33855 [Streptomyces agglomeratus]